MLATPRVEYDLDSPIFFLVPYGVKGSKAVVRDANPRPFSTVYRQMQSLTSTGIGYFSIAVTAGLQLITLSYKEERALAIAAGLAKQRC
jgi:hypothetical protein